MAILALAAQTGPGAPAPGQVAQRSAFFCAVAERPPQSAAEGVELQLREFSFLLSGPADTVEMRAEIETFDPARLLGGGAFVQFMRSGTSAAAYSALTGPVGAPGTMLLFMQHRAGPEWDAALGASTTGQPPRFVGRCFHLLSADAAAEFQSFNTEERR